MDKGALRVNPLIFLVGAALVLFLTFYMLRFIYDYRIKNNAVEILLFRLMPIYRLPVENIESIQSVGWGRLGIGGGVIRLGNRFCRHGVLIEKRRGWFRYIVITPADVEGFLGQIIDKVPSAKPSGNL